MAKALKQLFLGVMFLANAINPALAGPYSFDASRLGSVRNTPDTLRNSGVAFEDSERFCMGLALYHEARGEPITGQIAVAATILNRQRSTAYPDTICDVVYENEHFFNRCQFSFACDNLSDIPRNEALFEELMDLGDAVITGAVYDAMPENFSIFINVLANTTHYHRYDITTEWSPKLTSLGKMRNHVFFKSDRVVRQYRAVNVQIVEAHQTLILADAAAHFLNFGAVGL